MFDARLEGLLQFRSTNKVHGFRTGRNGSCKLVPRTNKRYRNIVYHKHQNQSENEDLW